MEKELQNLLNKIDVIQLRQELKPTSDRFNIFRILRRESDEVNLHSRFLHELLNPKGSHGMGTVFLQNFAEICKLPSLSYDTIKVLREHSNIDILIQDNQNAIVIENKIYAIDQHEQLKRYHDYTTKSFRKPTLLYLTLDGKKPTDGSMGDLQENVNLISYKNEIDRWLTLCIKEVVTRPILRETLIQYQSLVQHLTGNTMNNNEENEILDLMNQGHNAERGAFIARNWGHVRWHTEFSFWTELLGLVEPMFEVSPEQKFSSEALDILVWGGQKKNRYYGIMFRIGRIGENDINFKIERGAKPMYYGFLQPSSDANTRSRFQRAIQYLGLEQTEWWAGSKETEQRLDFDDFDNSTVTLQLANRQKRQEVVIELWREIQVVIEEGIASIRKEFADDFVPAKKNAAEY